MPQAAIFPQTVVDLPSAALLLPSFFSSSKKKSLGCRRLVTHLALYVFKVSDLHILKCDK